MASLIRKFYEASIKSLPSVMCWGTGSPLREFLHVDDLGNAVVFALENWDPNSKNAPKDENNNKFVYVKAIRIKEVCLNCHGSNISSDLKKEIQKLYPDDKAINYKLNDIRGAFVLYRNIKD